MEQLIELGSKLLNDQLGVNVDSNTLQSALGGLLGNGQGDIDIAGLASKFMESGGLADVVNSWLGDGSNSPISADTITEVLGSQNVADFAGKLGTDSSSAASGLADVLPQLVDKASSGGSLLESAGGLLGAAKSLF